MSHVAHELSDEFPAEFSAIQTLRQSDAHFARMADRYHELNRTLHRMESNVEPADDFTIEDLKKERLRLKDEISSYLRA